MSLEMVEDSPVGRVERAASPLSGRCVRARVLLAAIGGWLLLDQLLFWRFLGLIGDAATAALLLPAAAAVWWWSRASASGQQGPSLRVLLVCAGVSLLLLVLGGEGRFLYASSDWQVRGAVLRDLSLYPWPYVYAAGDGQLLLRTPIAMYLAPAAVGQLAGVRAAELALLVQNTLLLTAILGLGATLFRGTRARLIALALFIGFSGMDAAGQILAGLPLDMHPERWNYATYSAHVSLAFSVPQHAFAGWIGALLYLLWRDGRLPLGAALAPMPLLALWYPIALIGVLPFAAYAGIATLRARTLTPSDILAPAAATLIAVPSLLYLATGSTGIGGGAAFLPLNHYAAFIALEVGPYLLALAFIGRSGRFGGATLLIVAGSLLLIPFGQIGPNSEFVARASIPALAILSLALAEALAGRGEDARFWRGVIVVAFAIGLVTPVFEIGRALTYPPAPAILCSYMGVVPGGVPTYVVPLERVPAPLRPEAPARISPHDPQACFSGPWPEPLINLHP
jgi:hypothetical protein